MRINLLIIALFVLLVACKPLPKKNPIKMTSEGIFETVTLDLKDVGIYEIYLRISTTYEMSGIDFEPRMRSEVNKRAKEQCPDGVKSVDVVFEQLHILGFAQDDLHLVNNIQGSFECQ